jgi:hypothetical protein
METMLKNWILGMIAAAVLSAVLMSVLPKGTARRVMTFALSLATLTALVRPLMQFDYETFAAAVLQTHTGAGDIAQGGYSGRSDVERQLIQDALASYISDKGAALGVKLKTVTVKTRWSGEIWYPVSAELTTEGPQPEAGALAQYMESELGIDRSQQIWKTSDENADG